MEIKFNTIPAGGSAAQSELIHQRIRHLAQQAKVPVFTFAEDVAASGGCTHSLAPSGPCTKHYRAHICSATRQHGGACFERKS